MGSVPFDSPAPPVVHHLTVMEGADELAPVLYEAQAAPVQAMVIIGRHIFDGKHGEDYRCLWYDHDNRHKGGWMSRDPLTVGYGEGDTLWIVPARRVVPAK